MARASVLRVGSKEPKTDPDAPSTSQQYVNSEETSFGIEDRASTRKHPARISIPKWGLRDHNKKIKVSLPASRLRRTFSIHHWSEEHFDNLNFEIKGSLIEQNVDTNKASSNSEQVYILSPSFDEHNFDKKCDVNTAYSISHSSGPTQPDELENISQIKQQQEDVILSPSKEFLAMMKLFDGNIELIQNILDDPSYIFAHYLQAKQASNVELTRAYSFPAPRLLERKQNGQFRFKHKTYDVNEKFHSGTPKEEIMDGDEELTPKLVETNFSSSRFMAIKHSKKKEHRRVFMDGILHRIPFGRKVMEAMKKSKSGLWDVSTMEKFDREGKLNSCWNKFNKHVPRNIQRSHSLSDSVAKYSHLFESISKEEFKELTERTKVKSLDRILSFSDIKDCSSSKNAQSEAPFSCLENLTISSREKVLKKEESEEFTTEMSSENLSKDGLIEEENISISPPGEKLLDEALAHELKKPIGFLDYAASEGSECRYPSEQSTVSLINISDRVNTNGKDLPREKSFPDSNCFDSLLLQINPKLESKFNYVKEILRRSRFNSSDFLQALHSPDDGQRDPLISNEAEGLSYKPEITEDEYDTLLEHQLLFDLINEALVETLESFLSYFFPWLSPFNTNPKPMPMGDQILQEIWGNICWHFKGLPQLGINLEEIVSRNFMRNDRWMNIQYDVEDVVEELESLILDDLLDDAVLQLSLLPSFNHFPS
ncbi:uncharacterized protein LOC110026691 isoform X2 [Phalaenopsis equestris]|uniref:uncharacterized protein LOC110026691 isoform X2 n=1 Tax=Phalaenopsis equestris TaxID=78828 RepID=UPI0009E51995|nr:uncharacterized protein LOC110026691 isoform X2 [Phalaenopsis equestris]